MTVPNWVGTFLFDTKYKMSGHFGSDTVLVDTKYSNRWCHTVQQRKHRNIAYHLAKIVQKSLDVDTQCPSQFTKLFGTI